MSARGRHACRTQTVGTQTVRQALTVVLATVLLGQQDAVGGYNLVPLAVMVATTGEHQCPALVNVIKALVVLIHVHQALVDVAEGICKFVEETEPHAILGKL